MRPANIAVFLSGHGFGHLTRTATILEALCRKRPLAVRVITSAPASLWPASVRAHTSEWIDEPCDAGVEQVDDLSVNVAATKRAVETWQESSDARRDRIARRLSSERNRPSLIVGDVPALAFEVASSLHVPSVAIANFSWDWIYEQMELPSAAACARRSYRQSDLLLELTPAAPMPSFVHRRRIGTVGRDSSSLRHITRAALGVSPTERLVLLAFRNTTLAAIGLPPARDGWRYIATARLAEMRADAAAIPNGIEFAAALAASDAVVAKTGYGILADCAATGRPLLWVVREGFPEDRVLARWLASQSWTRRVSRAALAAGEWGEELTEALSGPPPAPLGDGPVQAACEALDELLS